jgi:hypothetical protein
MEQWEPASPDARSLTSTNGALREFGESRKRVEMKILGYVKNRVMLGMLLFFVAVGAWEFRFKPQYRPIYEQAIVSYQSKKYDEALEKIKTAYAIAPNAVDVMILIGWVNLKLNEFSEAE